MKMNETLVVGSMVDCRHVENHSEMFQYDPLWKQTIVGCYIVNILQEIIHFNVTYVNQEPTFDLLAELVYYNNKSVDFFVRPLSLRSDVMELAHPVHAMFDWNFGFTIYRPEVFIYDHLFYTRPFTRKLWYCLSVMVVFCSALLYCFKISEIRLVNGTHVECSFGFEVLMVIGAYCQHIPPIDAVLYSRRGAYFNLFMFAYFIYTYYTSNLLSYIVNDKDEHINAENILNSDLEGLILKDIMYVIWNNIAALKGNISSSLEKVFHMRPVTILEGLEALRSGNVALLSDYVTIEPFISEVFESYEICGLRTVDLSASVKKYFFVSKKFAYKEQFKLALLRMEEAGIIGKFMRMGYSRPECVSLHHIQAPFYQIQLPFGLLLGTYLLSVIILAGEVLHYRMNRIWPYVE